MDSLYTTTYIGNKPGSQDIYTHAETIDNILTIESAVLAGPEMAHSAASPGLGQSRLAS